MKIAFVCSSLEPGRDGVGDYTRRLAGEFIRQGHPSIAIALNETQLTEAVFEEQNIDGTSVSVLRLPGVSPWSQRSREASQWLKNFGPDWVSLQFVPFGFHPKGLCFGLGNCLAGLQTTAAWHVMFHELWLGLGENAPLKDRILGAFQRRALLSFFARLRPRVVHTQTEAYRIVLSRNKIAAAILPLISNIPRSSGEGWHSLLKPLVAKTLGAPVDRGELYLAGILGTVPPEWSAELTVNTLLPLAERQHKKLILVFLGKNNLTPAAFAQLRVKLQGRATVIVVGEQPAGEISKILQALDLGLATTPFQVIQKSGSVAAMLEHGLTILVTRNDWRLRGPDSPPDEIFPRLLSVKQFTNLNQLPTRAAESPAKSQLSQVADRMISALHASPQSSRRPS